MAINPETQYPGKITPSDANYPYGSARNVTTPGDGTGTPWEAAIVKDRQGMEQALLTNASIVPSGNPDTAIASQYFDAMVALFRDGKIRTISSSDSLVASDKIVFVDATAGDVTITPLSAAAMVANGASGVVIIKRIDQSSNTVIISGIEGDDIELEGTGLPFIKIASDGTTIYLVG